MKLLRQEIRYFFSALMFYTRIPCSGEIDHSEKNLDKATRYFPLMGWIVALGTWLVLLALHDILGNEISILLSMLVSILITGAFHEDGLADVCDGFGGGWTKEKILVIMKDSRVGTYGAAGLIIILLLKFFALAQLLVLVSLPDLGLILLSAHAMSRFSAIVIIHSSSYVSENAASKSKPIATKRYAENIPIALLWVVIPFAFLIYKHPFYALALVPIALFTVYLRSYFKRWIGGYTGDCLGATQQINEIVFYIFCIAIWKFI